MRRLRRLIARRKTSAYYFVGICSLGLAFGLSVAIFTGGGILSGTGLEREAHDASWVVEHGGENAEGSDGHDQTLVGDLLFGKRADAHAGGYCGHDARSTYINGVQHRQVFVEHTNGSGGHRWRGAHFLFNGTGYYRSSPWYYETADCH